MKRAARLAATGLTLALTSAFGCAPPTAAKPYPTAKPSAGNGATAEPPAQAPVLKQVGNASYFGRRVDLAPFLVGFPYGNFDPSLRTGKLFYLEMGATYALQMLDWSPQTTLALERGKTISSVDWSKRSLWGMHHHESSNTLWLHADASNDEVMNLWTLSLADGSLAQVTEHDYVYGFGFSADDSKIAYLPRAGKKAPYRSCLRILDVATRQDREIVCDDAQLAFTWSSPRFSPDTAEVYFTAQSEGDRNRVQVVRVVLAAKPPTVEVLTNPRRERTSPSLLEGWIDNELLFVANDDGFENLYALDRKSRKIRQITRFKEDLGSAARSGNLVIGVHGTPAGSTVVVIDPKTSKVLSTRKMPGTTAVVDAHDGRAYLSQTAPDIVYEGLALDSLGREAGSLSALKTVVALDPELEKTIVKCKATAVDIPTFDSDRKTGRRRKLHAFLLEPREPLENAGERLAMVTAFYGGSNRYGEFDNVMCAAGLTVLSASVRGSAGFGREFQALNDKDLGGDEIVDLFWLARWLERRAGLSARRIGVYGGSHGGYATMRALTFPPETNGRNESYAFGFGLTHAGFSSIKSFFDATNIPDWVVLESGDPKLPKDLERMLDRSPITHVERLQAPLFLSHGSQDWRVPVAESRRFAEKARALGRPVNYVEIEGQGHHIEGLGLQVQLYQARFDFLMAVAKAVTKAEASAGQEPGSPTRKVD